MTVRNAKLEDFHPLMQLMHQLNPDDPPPGPNQKKSFEAILDSENLTLFVGESNKSIVATCYLNVIPNLSRGGKPYAMIENVVTDHRFRNRGFGQALMLHAIESAWQSQCYKIMLLTGKKSPDVHAFYQKCGFNPHAKQAYLIRNPHMDIGLEPHT